MPSSGVILRKDGFYLQEYIFIGSMVGSYCKDPCDALFILRNTNNPKDEVLKSGLGLGTGDVLPKLIKDWMRM
jgi:hypothetical protein